MLFVHAYKNTLDVLHNLDIGPKYVAYSVQEEVSDFLV